MSEKTLQFSKICFGEDYYGQFHVKDPDDGGIDSIYKVVMQHSQYDDQFLVECCDFGDYRGRSLSVLYICKLISNNCEVAYSMDTIQLSEHLYEMWRAYDDQISFSYPDTCESGTET